MDVQCHVRVQPNIVVVKVFSLTPRHQVCYIFWGQLKGEQFFYWRHLNLCGNNQRDFFPDSPDDIPQPL